MTKPLLLLLALCLCGGCRSLRYQAGWNHGYKAYEKGLKTGYIKKDYGYGYVDGMTFSKTMHDLDVSIKKTNDYLHNWNAGRKKRRSDLDKEFQKLLDDAEKEIGGP